MPFLTVGNNHIDVDKIANVITPSKQDGREETVVVRYVWGAEEAFYGDNAVVLREWLAKRLEPVVPATVPFVQTKAEPKPATKDRR